MNNVSSWQQALVLSWGKVWTSFLSTLPTILGAILVFAIGLVMAYWVKRLVRELLRVVKLEKLSESLGIESYLKKAEISLNFSDLLATIVEWLVILVFFLAAVDILGLSVVSSVLAQVLGYIPNILAAALIFGAGFFVAGLVDNLVRGALVSVDHDAAKPIGKLARWVVMLVTFLQLLINCRLLRDLLQPFSKA